MVLPVLVSSFLNSFFNLGTWALGSLYCEKIMAPYQKMLAVQTAEKKNKDADKKTAKSKDKRADKKQKRGSVRERVDEILKDKK